MGSIWLRNLPQVISDAGLPVSVWPGWEKRSNSKGGYIAVHGIAAHHTASNTTPDRDMAYMWDNATLRPIGAIYLARDGKITVGAAGQTNCQGKGGPRLTSHGVIPLDQGNQYAIAIEAANTGTGEPWPTAQQDAYVQLCAALVPGYDLVPDDVFAHHEWTSRKIDPWGPSRYAGRGKWNMDLFREDVAFALHPSPTPEPPTPPPTENQLVNVLLKVVNPDGTLFCAALFYATVDAKGNALQCEWTGDGNPATPTGRKLAAHLPFLDQRKIGAASLQNMTLIGPLPTGDTRTWSAADFARVVGS